ncbi:ABC transporter ATP-binding protein [Mesorhizobium sp. VK24D]|uniref:ABC transporter ATP-binding protein n=1 Tax=Mesorhizobium album TaxID=3072314 RepID=A0ABU4Y6J9_9HYPH|nr:ABC transporter ATP-binding protein [Mesorhizobium sp. VK24D]MDX8482563.1 ABC transporter ATP-binding protein [Mesorhizobium sp. VK24D]
MASVRFENVSKVFGGLVAAHNLNFEINDGEFIVFVGPSGCGKTTTLRMLAGLERPSYGRICIGDRDVTLDSPGRRDISMVFQSYALFPHMTVYKNLAFGPDVRGMGKPEIDSRVRSVAETLHLDKLLDRYPHELSGGQRQRIALGRTMIRQPKIFLLDEPLSNLDAALRVSMRSGIIELQKRLAVTAVYVTHDQVEAMTMGDRIAVFKDGIILQFDTPQNIYQHPANTFVATFMGSPKMNLIPGTLDVRPSGAVAQLADASLFFASDRLIDFGAQPNHEVEVGIRPQDIHWVKDAPSRCTHTLRGSIKAIETTGPETYVTIAAEGAEFGSRFPSFAGIALGQSVELAVDPNDVYLFDRKTGRNLLLKGGAGTRGVASAQVTKTKQAELKQGGLTQ